MMRFRDNGKVPFYLVGGPDVPGGTHFFVKGSPEMLWNDLVKDGQNVYRIRTACRLTIDIKGPGEIPHEDVRCLCGALLFEVVPF